MKENSLIILDSCSLLKTAEPSLLKTAEPKTAFSLNKFLLIEVFITYNNEQYLLHKFII